MTTLEGSLLFVGVILFFISAFLNILFYRISVMYIERELAKEAGGFEPLELDKSIGARGMMYNQLILFKIKNHRFVDGEAVLRIARKKRLVVGVFFFLLFFISYDYNFSLEFFIRSSRYYIINNYVLIPKKCKFMALINIIYKIKAC